MNSYHKLLICIPLLFGIIGLIALIDNTRISEECYQIADFITYQPYSRVPFETAYTACMQQNNQPILPSIPEPDFSAKYPKWNSTNAWSDQK